MSLVDFMKQIQEGQDSIVYSEHPEPSIRVIPPEKAVSTKIIPPESETVKPPTTIKLKIKQKNVMVQNTVDSNIEEPPVSKEVPVTKTSTLDTTEVVKDVPLNTKPPNIEKDHISKPNKTESVEKTDDELFISSGTELSKKSIWIEYFNKSKTSRKNNPIVDRMKVGRFTITPDNKVLLLPDYDIVGKDPDDVLKDKWF